MDLPADGSDVAAMTGRCIEGHEFAGVVEDLIGPSVVVFIEEVARWSDGYEAPRYATDRAHCRTD